MLQRASHWSKLLEQPQRMNLAVFFDHENIMRTSGGLVKATSTFSSILQGPIGVSGMYH